uniref:Uncharacterized protein n=1 Tax=Avena sativa TaxID=4498 RepID=A0ACD5ZP60_AVESA
MKQPAASPGRAEKQQQLPAPPGLARLLLSKSRRGGRSRRAPATSPMFVSRGRSRGAAAARADGEPSSPKVTCIGQVRMRKGMGKKKGAAPATPEKGAGRGYCRCLKKAFLCGGLFDFHRGGRKHKAPSPAAERSRRSPWVFSSRDVAVAAAPKPPDPRSECSEEEDAQSGVGVGVFCSVERDEAEEPGIKCEKEEDGETGDAAAELVSSATTTPPKNALLLMRCRSAPQNRSSPLTARFAAADAPSPVQETADFLVEISATPPARASPSPRKPEMVPVESFDESKWHDMVASAAQEQNEEEARAEQEREDEDDDEEEEAEELRCSSARPLVLPRCKSEPATTAAAKMAAGIGGEAASSGCFWAHSGSSGRRRHAPPPLSPVSAAPLALTGH